MANTINKQATQERLVTVALKLAAQGGLMNLTRDKLAATAGVSTGIVSFRFGTMAELRRTIMRAAIKQEVLAVIAEGIALRNRYALAAPEELKRKALASL